MRADMANLLHAPLTTYPTYLGDARIFTHCSSLHAFIPLLEIFPFTRTSLQSKTYLRTMSKR